MAEIVKIRVPHDVVTLEVNEKGETITLPVSDERFTQKLMTFATEAQERAESVKNVSDSTDIMEVVDSNLEFLDYLRTEFDVLFGEGAYEKVYGPDILIGADYILEFLDQILPYIQKSMEKRATKLNKYNANRVGTSY